MGIVNMKTKKYTAFQTGFDDHHFVQYSSDGNIYCVAGSPTKFPCVIRVDPAGKVESYYFAKIYSSLVYTKIHTY